MEYEITKKISYIKKTLSLENINISDEELIIISKNQKRKKEINLTQTRKQTYKNWEDYFIEGTDILKNIPNIQNKEELKKLEKQISIQRLMELYDEPIKGNFDYEHLSTIHKYLFNEIYDWAGQTRTVNMSKTTNFCNHEKIENYLSENISDKINRLTEAKNKEELANLISSIFYHLIYAHPFREGNGRTIREFIRELINELEFEFGKFDIDFEKMDDTICALCLTYGPEMSSMFLTSQFFLALTPKKEKQFVLKH